MVVAGFWFFFFSFFFFFVIFFFSAGTLEFFSCRPVTPRVDSAYNLLTPLLKFSPLFEQQWMFFFLSPACNFFLLSEMKALSLRQNLDSTFLSRIFRSHRLLLFKIPLLSPPPPLQFHAA